MTLKDSDEGRLLSRLETLLQHYPVQADKEQEGWCSIHQGQMTQHHNAKGSW
jgi:hypothetical protein